MDHANYRALFFLEKIESNGSLMAKNLISNLDVSLRNYLRDLIPSEKAPESRNMDYCSIALSRYLKRRKSKEISKVLKNLIDVPIIQQADHSNLLFDSETLLNNLLYSIACQEAGSNMMITLQCSTVSCISKRRPLKGPTFLRTRQRLFNVFPLSKTTLKSSSFCALPKPIKTSFTPLDENDSKTCSFMNRFRGRNFSSSVEAYRRINSEFWQCLDSRVTVPAVFIDDEFTSELAALHLSDSGSPLYKIIYHPEVRNIFIDEKSRFLSEKVNARVSPFSTDFFWIRKANRLIPIELVNRKMKPTFVDKISGNAINFSFEPKLVVEALRRGDIYVDKFLAYFSRCLLSGIRALGGTSQQDYLACYQEILKKVNDRCRFLSEEDVAQVFRCNPGCLGGNPLLELGDEAMRVFDNIDPETNLHDFFDQFLDLPLGETIGSFQCASYLSSIFDCHDNK